MKKKLWRIPIPVLIAAAIILLSGGILIYALTKSTEAAGPVGYWKLDEGAGMTAYDASGNGNDGTLTNFDFDDDSNWKAGKVAGALEFDGTNDYVSVGNVGSVQTVEFWINDSNTTDGILELINNSTYISIVSSAASTTGFTSPTIYVNGVATSTLSSGWNHVAITTATVISAASVNIGEANSDYMDGKIDEVKIYDRALSADEVRWNYNRGGPVGWWKFDEGTASTTFDSSINSNTGTWYGSGSHWAEGKINGAGQFASTTSDYVNAGSGTSLDITNEITLEVWVFPTDSILTWQGIVTKKVSHGFISDGYSLYWHPTSGGFGFRGEGGNIYGGGGGTINTWNHVVVTSDGTNLYIYINGNLDKSGSSYPGSVAQSFYIGRWNTYNASYGNFFSGLIDDVRIYNYARTAAEIRTDYNFGQAVRFGAGSYDLSRGLVGHWTMDEGSGYTAHDSSANSNDGTLTNFDFNKDSNWTSGKVAGALQFDGSDDNILIGTDVWTTAQLANGTIEMFINLSNTTVNNQRYISIEDKVYFRFKNDGPGNLFRVYLDDGTVKSVSSSAISQNTWYHVVATWDGTTLTFYVNGQSVGTPASAGSPNLDAVSAATRIGSNAAGSSEFWDGLIDDVRIYNRALSADEIRYLYNRRGPVGWWKFDEGTASTTFDSSGNGNNGTWYGSGTHWAAGKINGAGQFATSTSDYVDIGRMTELEGASASWSIGGWYKYTGSPVVPAVPATWAMLFTYDDNDVGDSNDIYIYWNGNNGVYQIGSGGGEGTSFITDIEDGNWHHIVLVKTATRVLVYEDGGLKNDDAFAGGNFGAAWTFRIGDNMNVGFWHGLIDDVRIYNYARTAAEIRTDYNEGFAVKFGPSDSTGIDLERGLVGQWKLEEGNGYKAYDSSNEGNDGTLYNFDFNRDSDWTSGNPSAGSGQALKFDGSDDYISIAHNSSLSPSTGDFTISSWIKPDTVSGTQRFVWKNDGGVTFNGYYSMLTGSSFVFGVGDGASKAEPTGGTASVGNWFFVTGVRDTSAGKVRLYINGIETASSTDSSSDINYGGALELGGRSGAAEDLDGTLDDVRIYNRALSEKEIQQLYNRRQPIGWLKFDSGNSSVTTAYDSSINGNHGTIYGASSTAGKINRALSFDGTDDYVDAGSDSSLNITSAITLEAWINLNSISAANQDIVGKIDWASGGSNKGYLLSVSAGTNALLFRWWNNNGFDLGGSVLATDRWYHVVATADGTIARLYIDGVEDISAAAGSAAVANYNLMIGRYSKSAAEYFDGLIDDVRIYNYARSASEIRTDYNAGLATYFK